MQKLLPSPTVNIYWNKKTGEFLVQQHAPILTGDFAGTAEEYGPPIIVRPDQFDSTICDIVLNSFSRFQLARDNERPESPRTDEEQMDFAKQHLLVNVTRISSGKIRVTPCERRNGSYVGSNEEAQAIVDEARAEKELASVLREAFEKAK